MHKFLLTALWALLSVHVYAEKLTVENEAVAEETTQEEPRAVPMLDKNLVVPEFKRPTQDLKALLSVKTSFDNDLTYTPARTKTLYYFDFGGQLVSKGEEDGFYRQILGKTSTGQTVAQDFFFNTKVPHTAPFIVQDEKEFWSHEGRVVTFREEGKVEKIEYFNPDGLSTMWSLYQVIGGFIYGLGDGNYLYFTDDERLFAAGDEWSGDAATMVFYHENGKPMMVLQTRENENESGEFYRAWNEASEEIDFNAVRQSFEPLEKMMFELLAQIKAC